MKENMQEIYANVVKILSNNDYKKALIDFYNYIAEYLPIDGALISFSCGNYRFLPQFYLIRKDRIDFLGNILPLDRDHALYFRSAINANNIYNRGNNSHAVFSYLNDINIKDKIPFKERSHLINTINIEGLSIGLLRFLGKTADCFSQEHEKLLSSLSIQLTQVITSLYHDDEVYEFLSKHNLASKQVHEINSFNEGKIIGKSPKMFELIEDLYRLASTDESVLILGETGTGKEVIAHTIQANSVRAQKPFIKVNCGAIPENLIDSILFGYEKGAFTGADKATAGKFEQADGGTLFLDELGELSLSAQVRLLRILQDYQVDRIGGLKSIPVNVRIIAATNKDLRQMVCENTFREDLFYRINTFRINIPPLRERKDDIPVLCKYFIETICKKMKLPIQELPEKALADLIEYHWPGNVRELENVIRSSLVLDIERDFDPAKYIYTIDKKELNRDRISETTIENDKKPIIQDISDEIMPLDDMIKNHIKQALKKCRGQIHGEKGAAKILQLNPETLRKRIIKLGLREELDD